MARDQLRLAARFAERIWDSPLGDFLQALPAEMAERITTDLILGLLLEIGD